MQLQLNTVPDEMSPREHLPPGVKWYSYQRTMSNNRKALRNRLLFGSLADAARFIATSIPATFPAIGPPQGLSILDAEAAIIRLRGEAGVNPEATAFTPEIAPPCDVLC